VRVYCHYCKSVFSNCYIVGNEPSIPNAPVDAVIIDPGIMDLNILSCIEDNKYSVKGIFITRDHPFLVSGLATLLRVYDAEVFAINPSINNIRSTVVRDGETINSGSISVDVISIPRHSSESAVYKIDNILFTGDSLTAGLIGKTISSYSAITQVSSLRSKILSLPGDYAIFPGSGPPTSLNAERRFNLGIAKFEALKPRRKNFRLNL